MRNCSRSPKQRNESPGRLNDSPCSPARQSDEYQAKSVVWLGHYTELTNAHAARRSDIIHSKARQGEDTKKVRMQIANQEHIWRIGKKWVGEQEPIHVDEDEQEEMVPKRLYDELLLQF